MTEPLQQLKTIHDKVKDRIEAYKAIHNLSEEEYQERMRRWYANAIEQMTESFKRFSP